MIFLNLIIWSECRYCKDHLGPWQKYVYCAPQQGSFISVYFRSHDLPDLRISQISWSPWSHNLPDLVISYISLSPRSHDLQDLMISQISWSPKSHDLPDLMISQISWSPRSHDLLDLILDLIIDPWQKYVYHHSRTVSSWPRSSLMSLLLWLLLLLPGVKMQNKWFPGIINFLITLTTLREDFKQKNI